MALNKKSEKKIKKCLTNETQSAKLSKLSERQTAKHNEH